MVWLSRTRSHVLAQVLSEKKREKREAKQKKKEEKERKKCMVRKNVFQLTTPPLGDLMPGNFPVSAHIASLAFDLIGPQASRSSSRARTRRM